MRILLPDDLDHACALLAGDEEIVPIAGGTDLMVHWPGNLEAHERTYLDLSGLAELRELRWTDDGELLIGGAVTYWQTIGEARIERELPMLISAARQVGAVQIQTRGTWAGNIVNASPAADGVPVLMAYDAVLDLVSSAGNETIALADFYTGYKTMRLRSDQLVRSIRVPCADRDVQTFEKVGSRRAQAITKVGAAIAHGPDGWRVVANSLAPTVCRCRAVEAQLESETPVTAPDDLVTAIRKDVSPIDDIRSTARYRERVFARVLYYALREAKALTG